MDSNRNETDKPQRIADLEPEDLSDNSDTRSDGCEAEDLDVKRTSSSDKFFQEIEDNKLGTGPKSSLSALASELNLTENDTSGGKEDLASARKSKVTIVSVERERLESEDNDVQPNKIGYSSWLKYCDTEVLMVLLGLTIVLSNGFQDNVIYRQVCVHEYQQGRNSCFTVGGTQNNSYDTSSIQNILESAVNVATVTLIFKWPTQCVTSIFLCPWSDKYGRKFPLILSVLGGNLDIIVYFFEGSTPLNFRRALYTGSFLSSFFGGTICTFAMSYSYLTDHTSVDFRTLRFTTMDVAYVVGQIAGHLIFQNISRNALLYSSLIIITVKLLAALWIVFTFEEEKFKENLLTKLKGFCTLLNAESNIEALFKWRNNSGCDQLRLLVLSAAPTLAAYGLREGVVTFSSTHAAYFWSFGQYKLVTTLFVAYSCVLEVLGLLFIQFFAKSKDSHVGLLGFVCLYVPSFMMAFAKESGMFIAALALGGFKCFASISIRASVSKIAADHEIGKLMFLVSASEVLGLYFTYILHIQFNFFLAEHTFPSLPYMILCTFLLLPLCTFIFQAISIETEELFSLCYRTIRVPPEVILTELYEQPTNSDDEVGDV